MVTTINLIMEFFMIISCIKTLILTITVLFNAFEAYGSDCSNFDAIYRDVMSTTNAVYIHSRLRELQAVHEDDLKKSSAITATTVTSTIPIGYVAARKSMVITPRSKAILNDMYKDVATVKLHEEIAKEQKTAGSGDLSLYLVPTMAYLRDRTKTWFEAVIPDIRTNAALDILDKGRTVAVGNNDVPAATLSADIATILTEPTHGSVTALNITNAAPHNINGAKPADNHADTFIERINAILDSLTDQAVLKTVPRVVATGDLVANIAVPKDSSDKSIAQLRTAVIKAVSLTLREYIYALMGGEGNRLNQFIHSGIVFVANPTADTTGTITTIDMIPKGHKAAHFADALDAFLIKQ